jgi:hypothetical protein
MPSVIVLGWILESLVPELVLKVREPCLRWNKVFLIDEQRPNVFLRYCPLQHHAAALLVISGVAIQVFK